MNFTLANTLHFHHKLPYSFASSGPAFPPVASHCEAEDPLCSRVSVRQLRGSCDTLPPSESDESHLSFSGPDRCSDYLFEVISCLTPAIWCLQQFASTLKLCSLNTLFGSSVGPLQFLQLGFGYRLLPTESEGTKSQIRTLKKILKRTGEQDHKVFMEICL